MPTIFTRVFAKRSLGGWILLALFVIDKAISTWSNAEFLAAKLVGAWDIVTALGRTAFTEANVQWALLIGGLLWIGIAATRPAGGGTVRPAQSAGGGVVADGTANFSDSTGRSFTTIAPERLTGFFGGDNTGLHARLGHAVFEEVDQNNRGRRRRGCLEIA